MNANRHAGSDRQRTSVPGSVPSDSSLTLPVPGPEGTSDNSPPFQRWVRASEGIKSRRDGRKEGRNTKAPCCILSSLRDSLGFRDCLPSVETLGYFRMSLRDNGRRPGQGNFRKALVLAPMPFGNSGGPLSRRDTATIAQRFNTGTGPLCVAPVPKGRLNPSSAGRVAFRSALGRPFGTWGLMSAKPSVETLGYSRVSLRDKDRWPGQGRAPSGMRLSAPPPNPFQVNSHRSITKQLVARSEDKDYEDSPLAPNSTHDTRTRYNLHNDEQSIHENAH